MKLLYAFAVLIHFAKADYYWRDFYGRIPFDAVEGGTDLGGNPTFIGQSFFPNINALYATTIYQGDRFAYKGSEPHQKTNKFTKILCSQNKDDLQWIRTNVTDMYLITECKECNHIIVGYKDKCLGVLGRANYQGVTYTGEVYEKGPKKWWDIMIRDLNNNLIELPEFEVLTYGCKKQFTSSPTVDTP